MVILLKAGHSSVPSDNSGTAKASDFESFVMYISLIESHDNYFEKLLATLLSLRHHLPTRSLPGRHQCYSYLPQATLDLSTVVWSLVPSNLKQKIDYIDFLWFVKRNVALVASGFEESSKMSSVFLAMTELRLTAKV